MILDYTNSMTNLKRLSRDYTNYKWAFGEKPPKEDLEYLYVECQLSQDEIAKVLGGSKSGVGRWLQHYNIRKPAPKVDAPKLTSEILNKIDWSRLSRNFLEQPWKRTDVPVKSDFEYLYIELNLSAYDIAQIIGKSTSRVQAIIRKLGIKKPMELHQKSRENMNLRRHGTRFANATPEALAKKVKTNMENFGVPSLLCKREFRESCMTNKYGKAHPQQVEEIKKRTRETFKEHYGKEHYFETDEFKEYTKQYNIDKYGVDNVFKLQEFQDKATQTMIDKYGVPKYAQGHIKHIENMNREYWLSHFYDKKIDAFDIDSCMLYHGISLSCLGNKLKEFNIELRTKYSSKNEFEIYKFFQDNGVNVKRKDRKVIAPMEIDIYLPEYHMGVEFDGLAFHSSGPEGTREVTKNVSPHYHIHKTDLCKNSGVQLLHIFENEWVDACKRDIWKSVLLNKIGKSHRIYARKTDARLIDTEIASIFCSENHLQGGCSCSVALGLFSNDELVAVMTFGKPRFNKNYDWELIRYCCKKYCTVVGGASKLLSAFKRLHKGSIISYANLRWSDGKLYENLGFKLVRKSEPNYFYFKVKHEILPTDMVLHSRVEFQKHKLKGKLEVYDENLSEKENMYMNNYRTIYDCGNLVYVLRS